MRGRPTNRCRTRSANSSQPSIHSLPTCVKLVNSLKLILTNLTQLRRKSWPIVVKLANPLKLTLSNLRQSTHENQHFVYQNSLKNYPLYW